MRVLDRPLEAYVQVNALADAIRRFLPYSALSQHTIDVWIARVDLSEGGLKEWVYVLDDEERARQGRYQLPFLGCRFAARRVFLRRVLASYLDVSPEQIRLRYEGQGKPSLDHRSDLEFSLAHTRNSVAIAVARGRSVGIDLETLRNDVDFELIANNYFCNAEIDEIFSAGPDVADTFFRYWTAKESYLKAIGTGLTVALNSFEVRAEPEGRTDRLAITTQSDISWTCCAWKLSPELCCAITSEGTGWSIRIRSAQWLNSLGLCELLDCRNRSA